MALDFRTLRYFVAVAEELHFTRAAERLYIAQPALSEQIRRLEGELGVQLLRRTTRKVELTPAGEEFLTRARRILGEADAALADASRAARGETGSIRISTGATAGVEQVPRVLRAFREARPEVALDLRQINWEDHSGGLNDGSVDAAFVWLPFEHDGLDFEVLHEEPRVAALEAGHPLTAHAVLRMEQLVDEPWPWVDTDRRALDFWTCVDYRGGAAARRGPTISSMEGILEGVRAGLCVAAIPRSHAAVSAWPGIAFRPVADLAPASLALGWRVADETPVVQALVEIARRVAADAATPGDSSDAPD
ncbi:MAG TPA: LysR family transcriptional regulator [Solirubrobacteraceae bacterium]|nr:LysR family transcriptional regulator [Solirubrobacteraceae bacterium]